MEHQTPSDYAPVILKLLKGVIYKDDSHWEQLQSKLVPVKQYFAQIGLQVRNHEGDGFAYLTQPESESEGGIEPLPRLTTRHPLSYKVTVLCVLLREELRKFDISNRTDRCVLSLENIRDLLTLYLPPKNDEAKFRKEVEELVNKVKDLGFLKSLSTSEKNYEILPIIKAKIDVNTLEELKAKLENYVHSIGTNWG